MTLDEATTFLIKLMTMDWKLESPDFVIADPHLPGRLLYYDAAYNDDDAPLFWAIDIRPAAIAVLPAEPEHVASAGTGKEVGG